MTSLTSEGANADWSAGAAHFMPILDESSQVSHASALASASQMSSGETSLTIPSPIASAGPSAQKVPVRTTFSGSDGPIRSSEHSSKRFRMDNGNDTRSVPLAGIKRSQSVIVTSAEAASFLSPKREPSPYSFGARCQKVNSSKPVMTRANSFSEGGARRLFDNDELLLDGGAEGGASLSSDNRSSSSLSTITDLSIGAAAGEDDRRKWLRNQDMRKRPASTSALDDEQPASKVYSSPPILSRLVQDRRPSQVTDCVRKFSGLDFSRESIPPGGGTLFGKESFSGEDSFELPRAAAHVSVTSQHRYHHDSSPEQEEEEEERDWHAVHESAMPAPPRQGFLPPPIPVRDEPHPPAFLSSMPFATPTREQLVVQHSSSIDVTQVVQKCKDKVKVVILDLDNTLLSIHTNGEWRGSPEDLARNIRPVFKKLVRELLQNDLPVAIATLSTQEALIQDMLISEFGEEGRNILVRGSRVGEHFVASQGDDEDEVQFGSQTTEDDEDAGKRRHIQSILDMLPNGRQTAPQQILFVDDDGLNVNRAIRDSHRVVLYKGQCSDKYFLDECCSALSK